VKIAYLDCASGISGDMTLGALIDAGVDAERIRAGIGSLGLPDCKLVIKQVSKHGFRATQVVVEHPPEHAHRHLSQISKMIDRGQLSPRQRELAKRIFTRLAEAEAKVHGTTIEKVHFHEVGAVDSIADIVGSAIAWDILGVERVVSSPVPTGTGSISIAHGRSSIPAPATAELLKGIPLAATNIEAELTTPTGAAILSTLVESYGPLPAMKIERIGYGAGQRDLPDQPNVLRLFVGQTSDEPATDQACLLETNLDDASGELIGYCIAQLWEAGALDVYTTAIQMKKNRPGVMLSVLCQAADAEKMEAILFRETTTLGLRRSMIGRRKLQRKPHTVQTPWGPIDGKLGWMEGQPPGFSPEYESACRVAREQNVPLKVVYEAAILAWRAESQ
jgi:uncharacterized protein (TIGR00299 family) protein